MFTNSNAVKHKTLYAPRALLDVYALGTVKTLGPGGPRPFKLVALEHQHFHNALDT
jgi:hypothetical protein